MEQLSGVQALVAVVILIAGPSGAAWVAVKASLNGARQDIRDIKASVGGLTDRQSATDVSVARLEVRVGNLEDRAA